MEIDWFYLTIIILIISICVYNTLESYFRHKYGKRDNETE